jgi:Arc/MetJ-type ribon-helix-helix transcriptional regulator
MIMRPSGTEWETPRRSKKPLSDLPEGAFCPILKTAKPQSDDSMAIHLTPEQERRIQAVIRRGAYESVEEVVDAALTAVEQRTVPGFAGTPQELDSLLAEGLASEQLTEAEFWGSIGKQTDTMLDENETDQHP